MTREAFQDQVRYCDRCGIAFLWSAEEQAQAQTPLQSESSPPRPQPMPGAPVLCAGCRALLPAPGRERGLVKWFNYRKRFGFIVRQHQPELFVHGSDVLNNARLHPGDLVEFSVEESERGPVAKNVHVLMHSEAPVAPR